MNANVRLGWKADAAYATFSAMRTLLPFVAALLNLGCASRSELPLQTGYEGPCVPFDGVTASHKWLTGHYSVVPIAAEHQAQLIHRLTRGGVEQLDEMGAKALTGNATLPQAAHYYLVRVGYVGDGPRGTLPTGVTINADVDTEGVAYVTSYRLSESPGTSEIAAVLVSPTPLKRVVSTCTAAW